MRRLARQTVTVVTPGVTLDRGREVEDWSKPVRTPLRGCSVQPGNGERDYNHADGVVADYTVFAPAGSQVDPRARIELPNITGQYLLLSPPEAWETGLRADHVRLRLRRRDG